MKRHWFWSRASKEAGIDKSTDIVNLCGYCFCVFIVKYIFVSLKLLSLSIISNQEWKLKVERKETKLRLSSLSVLSPLASEHRWPSQCIGGCFTSASQVSFGLTFGQF